VSEIILEVKDLKTYFYVQEGVVKAVDGLSYMVEKGQCIAIVGESGCGKSVSAMSILRLIPYPPGVIVGGEIIFDGIDLLKISENEIRKIRGDRIGMVFQEPTTSLNPVLSINQQLSESLRLHCRLSSKDARDQSINLLKLVGIPNSEKRVDDYPYQFSGGMQQRIMIAMAMCCNPALLIADEPTTALDVTVQAQLLEILNNMRTKFNTAVIIITHNLGVVARYAERVEVMYAGRLVEDGKTDDIFEDPRHPYTMGLISSVPRLDLPKKHGLNTIKGLPPNLARLPTNMCAFSGRCKFAIPKCQEQRPELEMVGTGHLAACFRRDELPHLSEAG
jgi:oligopeptide transport system ATP-binding protein